MKIESWLNKCLHWKKSLGVIEDEFSSSAKIDLYELSDVLSDILPDECTLVTDSGYNEVILPTNIKFKNGQNAIHPISQGAMGFALAGGVGAFYAKRDNVFIVVGDGSIMMNIQELQTIKHNNINEKSREPIDKCSQFNTDDFKHQELTNIHDDIPAIHEQGIQSIRPGLYNISNFHDCECKTPNTSRIANNHPTLIHQDDQ